MISIIDFILHLFFSAVGASLLLVFGFSLWDKKKYPFSWRKWIAVFLIFTSIPSMIGVQIGTAQRLEKIFSLSKEQKQDEQKTLEKEEVENTLYLRQAF